MVPPRKDSLQVAVEGIVVAIRRMHVLMDVVVVVVVVVVIVLEVMIKIEIRKVVIFLSCLRCLDNENDNTNYKKNDKNYDEEIGDSGDNDSWWY